MSDRQTHSPVQLSDVAATSLVTLYCRAIESQSSDPILQDDQAVAICERLRPQLAAAPQKLLRNLAKGKVPPDLVVHIALRAWKYDQYGRDFLTRHPDGIVANLGCGMDTRFNRITNGQAIFFDLDLPEVIQFKRNFIDEEQRYHMIASSVFDYAWMDALVQYGKRPVLFLAEGVFMYLEAEKVKSLVLTLRQRFPGSELVCEVVNQIWLSKPLRGIVNFKMQQQLNLGRGSAYHFGIRESRALESWHPGLEFLEEWSYFDTDHPKLGRIGRLGKFEWIRKVQWTIRYRLN